MSKNNQDEIQLRAGTPEDAEVCGRVCYEAFKMFADRHNFPTEIPTPEFSVELASMLLSHPGFYSVVAERDGEVIGSNYLDERGLIGATFSRRPISKVDEQKVVEVYVFWNSLILGELMCWTLKFIIKE